MVCVLLGEGFEEAEAIVPTDLMRRAGLDVVLAGIGARTVHSSHRVAVTADCTLEEVEPGQVELLFLPGGLGGVAAIQGSPAAVSLIRETYAAGRYVAAICAAPTLLGTMGLLKGRRAVCYPGMESDLAGADVQYGAPWVVDGNVVTGEAAGSALPFGLKLVELLKGRRAAEGVAESVHYHGSF